MVEQLETMLDPADDARVRAALMSLSVDVAAVPTPSAPLVRRRAVDAARARRRRWAASAAVAAAVVALVVIVPLASGPDQREQRLPAGPLPSPTATAPTATPLTALPVASDWQWALGLARPVTISDTTEEFPRLLECNPEPVEGTRSVAELVRQEAQDLTGHQHLYTFASDAGARAVAEEASRADCKRSDVVVRGEEWPRVYLRIGAGYQHWRVLALNGPRLAMLDLTDTGSTDSGSAVSTRWSSEQVLAIAAVAQENLDAVTAPTPAPTTSGSRPVEEVPVEGTQPLLPADLFIAPADWTSPDLSDGHATDAVSTDFEGSADVVSCDPDRARDGTPEAGRFGIVAIADAQTGRVLGKQRVRLTSGADASAAEVQRLLTGLRACSVPEVTVTFDPDNPARAKVVRKVDGEQDLVTWVGVTTQQTETAVTTVVVTAPLSNGPAELARLMTLARER